VPTLGKAKTRYVKEHYKEVKVKKDFYEDLRRLAEERGLSVPALIEEMFKQYTAPSMPAHTAPRYTQNITQGRGLQLDLITVPVRITKEDYMWWTIRVGEGFNTIEISLNNIQLRKLCQAKLLAQEVCEKINLSKP
jgi:hypothetical protein